MRTSRWGVAAGTAAWLLATAIALAGCAIAPSGGADGGGSSGGGQSGQSDAGDTSTEADTGGTDGDTGSPGDVDLDELEGLPSTFPTDEIPLIDNPVEMGIDLGTGWSLLMLVDDHKAAFSEASTLLKGAGFTAIAEQVSDPGGFGVYENEKYQIQLAGSDAPDNGPQLTYVVILRG